MKYLSPLAFMLLLCTAFTSCLPEVSITQTEEVEFVSPDEDVTTSSSISFGSQSLHPNYAFLRTTPNEAGDGFNHVLVLTQSGVAVRGGDLTDYTSAGIIGIAFSSATESPVGNFPVLAEDASSGETGVMAAGGHSFFSFLSPVSELVNRSFASGSMDVVQDGDDYKIEIDLVAPGNDYSITGRFVGGVEDIILPEAEEVSAEEFSGESMLKRDSEEIPLQDAYLVEQESNSSDDRIYRLFLTEETVQNNGESLSGTTNALLMKLTIGNELKSGRYVVGREGSLSSVGFFARNEKDFVYASYLCRDMNFDTNSMLDDEPMDAGEVVILVEEDQVWIKFDYESTRGASLSGEYKGGIHTLLR